MYYELCGLHCKSHNMNLSAPVLFPGNEVHIMFNLSLTACSFYFKKTYSRKLNKIFLLNSEIAGVHNEQEYSMVDAKELFEMFFRAHENMEKDDVKKQTFSCKYKELFSHDTAGFRMIYAKIQSGIYGTSSEIYDADAKRIKLKKSATDIDVRPFYLFVVLPKDSESLQVQKGILIFQNVGQFGVKTITTELMQAFFSTQYGITIVCKTIAPELFIKKVIRKDNIKKLVMVKNVKSADDADIGMGYGKEVREIGDLCFTDNLWSKIYNKILWVAGGKSNLFEFEQKRYDTLKVVVDIGGRNRKIDLHNLENLSIIEAIPDEIRMADGHPKEDMLIEHFTKVAAEYLDEMVLRVS